MVVFSREKESVPYWNKFLQGYYDSAGISEENFDQAVRVAVDGAGEPSPEMVERGIELTTSVAATVYYFGFNMKDPVVGGSSGARASRPGDLDRRRHGGIPSIFLNGRGIVAHSPLPPGIFGARDGREALNLVTHGWGDGRESRRPLAERRSPRGSGLPEGRDAEDRRTARPLFRHDLARAGTRRGSTGGASSSTSFRSARGARDRLEPLPGKDPQGHAAGLRPGLARRLSRPGELPLPAARPASADGAGSNSSNYTSPEFDALFERMKNMPNSPERQALIDRMVDIAGATRRGSSASTPRTTRCATGGSPT